MRHLTVLITLFSLAQPVAAHVKLVPGFRPSVAVESTPSGPWTVAEDLVGDPGPLTLNPAGDLVGDGAPGWAVSGSTALVAWVSSSADSVRMATSSWTGWNAILDLPISVDAYGTPHVAGTGSHFFVAWRSTPSSPQVFLVAVSRNGRTGGVFDLGPGRLIGLAAVDGNAHVIIQEPDGGLVTHGLFPIDDLIPDLERLSTVMLEPGPVGMPTPGGLGRRGLTSPPLGSASPGRGRSADLRPRVHRDDSWAVATWWPSPWLVKAVAFEADGPILPATRVPSVVPYVFESELSAVERALESSD